MKGTQVAQRDYIVLFKNKIIRLGEEFQSYKVEIESYINGTSHDNHMPSSQFLLDFVNVLHEDNNPESNVLSREHSPYNTSDHELNIFEVYCRLLQIIDRYKHLPSFKEKEENYQKFIEGIDKAYSEFNDFCKEHLEKLERLLEEAPCEKKENNT